MKVDVSKAICPGWLGKSQSDAARNQAWPLADGLRPFGGPGLQGVAQHVHDGCVPLDDGSATVRGCRRRITVAAAGALLKTPPRLLLLFSATGCGAARCRARLGPAGQGLAGQDAARHRKGSAWTGPHCFVSPLPSVNNRLSLNRINDNVAHFTNKPVVAALAGKLQRHGLA